MFKLIVLVVGCIYVATVLGQTQKLECYHCYESENVTLSLRSSDNNVYGERFAPCAENKLNWTTWTCPAQYTVCFIMSGKAGNRVEILRSCGRKNICKTYRPPSGVIMESCRECNTTFCNEELTSLTPTLPPPEKTKSFINFNINVKLTVKKDPTVDIEFLK